MHTTKISQLPKQMHPITSIWLYLVILANLVFCAHAVFLLNQHYWAPTDNSYDYLYDQPRPDKIDLYMRSIMHAAFIAFAIGILFWKKAAFWGIAAFSCIPLVFKIDSGQEDVFTYFYAVAGVVVLYMFLQIKQNGKSGWSQLA